MFENLFDQIKVSSNDELTTVVIPVPGLSSEDLKIELDYPLLNVSSEKENFQFYRTYKLSNIADTNSIKAECKNGLLTVEVPKKKKNVKLITIK